MKEGVGTRPLFHEGERKNIRKAMVLGLENVQRDGGQCIRRGGLANGGNVRLVGWGPVEENKKH